MTRTKHPLDARRDADLTIIGSIADRAVLTYAEYGVRVERRTIMLDLISCHFNAQKLRLDELLAADDFNFIHDVGGINKNLDPLSLELKNCFRPRFAVRDQDGNSGGYDRVPAEVRGLI